MGRLNLIERRLERFLREPPSVRNAAGVIVVATAVVMVGAGALITLVDSEKYPNVGLGSGGRSRRSPPSATATSRRSTSAAGSWQPW
jgi:hypothetical protein